MFTLGSDFGELMFTADGDMHRLRLAIGLERYYLAQDSYPDTLAQLIPNYLSPQASLDSGLTISYEHLANDAWRIRQTVLSNEPHDWNFQR